MNIYDFTALLNKNHIETIGDYDIESEVSNAKALLV
jgi:hypothetical protein